MGHIRMMSAVQPFLSGAISKTVNMPKESTMQDILQVYVEGWKLGLKAVAIYRDGSKRAQPLNVRKSGDKEKKPEAAPAEAKFAPHRHRLPATRPSITHKFDVAGHEGYLNVGLYDDGKPGELFITMAKEGSTVGGMMDAFATAISLCLQYGVPLEALVKKFSHQRFEPNGMTSNKDIPFAKSIVDYVFRWLGLAFIEEYRKANLPQRADHSPKVSDMFHKLSSPKAAPRLSRKTFPRKAVGPQRPLTRKLRGLWDFTPTTPAPPAPPRQRPAATATWRPRRQRPPGPRWARRWNRGSRRAWTAWISSSRTSRRTRLPATCVGRSRCGTAIATSAMSAARRWAAVDK